MSHIDAIAEIITYLNRRDFGDISAVPSAHYPLFANGDRVNAHFAHFTLDSIYQPILDVDNECIVAYEALLQIHAPAGISAIGGACSPATLFQLGADIAEITYLDRLARTLHALNFLLQDNPGALHLNVHPQHLLAVDGNHGEVFENILRQCGLAPSHIVLEVEEHAILKKARLADALGAWRSRGYRIAIDNFGATHMDIEPTLELRPDFIKIDKTLMRDEATDRISMRELGKAITRARGQNIAVIAAGIESQAQLNLAQRCGADYAQGYWLGTPIDRCLVADHNSVSWER